jgi:hypothetical protein
MGPKTLRRTNKFANRVPDDNRRSGLWLVYRLERDKIVIVSECLS